MMNPSWDDRPKLLPKEENLHHRILKLDLFSSGKMIATLWLFAHLVALLSLLLKAEGAFLKVGSVICAKVEISMEQ